jgi:hypothetical protein
MLELFSIEGRLETKAASARHLLVLTIALVGLVAGAAATTLEVTPTSCDHRR